MNWDAFWWALKLVGGGVVIAMLLLWLVERNTHPALILLAIVLLTALGVGMVTA